MVSNFTNALMNGALASDTRDLPTHFSQLMARPVHPNTSDQKWVARILAGDSEAWNQFVLKFTDRVWRRAWQLCSESCPYNKAVVHCVFHSLAKNKVQSVSDKRVGCDDGLEIYAFTFDYFYNHKKKTGKLNNYDGRSALETFVASVLHGTLRVDWIRHKRKIRIDQITRPAEIKELSETEGKIFEQMVMHRSTEIIARNLSLTFADVEDAQKRITHALVSKGNLHLVLKDPEGAYEEDEHDIPYRLSVIPIQQSVERIWETICSMIKMLPENEKLILDMVFDRELDATTILETCSDLNIDLPVKPRTGNVTIHSIYQSVDFVLKKIGNELATKHQSLLAEANNWLEGDSTSSSVSVKGLKALLKDMGIRNDIATPVQTR